MSFFLEVLIAGLLSGVMYSLVALGFVLIFKASGVFNFAQGTLVLFAALAFVSLMDWGLNFWVAMAAAFALMVALGLGVERVVLRPMVNQPPITLLMVTIGLSFFLEGLAQMLFGNQVHELDLGISDDPIFLTEYWAGAPDILISSFDIFAACTAGVLVAVLALFFNKTKHGRALRAVADDPAAAMSVGIPLQHVTALVWAVAGFVALVAGLLWGSRLGVQFALTLIALKALPVLIIGGFTSIAGAIVGGLVIGASEKLAELYVGDWLGLQGIENWFPYMLALLFLLFRPNGLFGEKTIARV